MVQGAIDAIHKDTGFQVAVALMGRTRSGDSRGASRLARGLHDSWGVGEKDKNNGVLFLLAKYDRQMYISTGKGAMRQLPDDALDKIIARAKPQLREEKYDKAVEQVVDDIGAALGGEVLPEVEKESEVEKGWGNIAGAAILLYFAFKTAKSRWDRHTFVRQYRQATRHLESLHTARCQAVGPGSYVCTSCPICLQDFPPSPPPRCEPSLSHNRSPDMIEAALVTMEQNLPNVRRTPGEMVPVTISCGHMFCEKCILNWMRQCSSSPTCPICRARISEAPQHGGQTQGGGSERQPSRPQMDFQPELAYRLGRLNFFFPRIVTPMLVERWSHYSFQHSFVDDLAYEDIRSEFKSYTTSSRSHGGSLSSSFSFGGGSSGGGGGRGGSW